MLNGGTVGVRVPETTRLRVQQVMQEVGYVPNVAAQRLAGGRNRILGVFTYEPVFPSSTRDFFSLFLEGIEEAAAELDYDLLLHTRPAHRGEPRQVYRNGTSRLSLADGTIMLGQLEETRRTDLARLISEGHPVVYIGRRELPGQELPYVTADYAAATQEALQHLISRGHTQTLYVGHEVAHESAIDREQGYLAGLDAVRGQVIRVPEVTLELVQSALESGVTGVLFENERLAEQWIEQAESLGAVWPQDYAFAVLGEPIFAGDLPPEWAHFSIPRLEMGRQSVHLLSQALLNQPSQSVNLPCKWREGRSLGGAR